MRAVRVLLLPLAAVVSLLVLAQPQARALEEPTACCLCHTRPYKCTCGQYSGVAACNTECEPQTCTVV